MDEIAAAKLGKVTLPNARADEEAAAASVDIPFADVDVPIDVTVTVFGGIRAVVTVDVGDTDRETR